MQASVEDIYNTFVNIVAEGRSLEPTRVDQLAQGRVWLGSDALDISLVDEIGTLEDAIVYAAGLAGLHTKADYRVVSFPKPLTMAQQLSMALGQGYGPCHPATHLQQTHLRLRPPPVRHRDSINDPQGTAPVSKKGKNATTADPMEPLWLRFKAIMLP